MIHSSEFPISAIIIGLLVFFGLIVAATFTRKYIGKDSQEKIDTACRLEFDHLMREILFAPHTDYLACMEESIDVFIDRFIGRVDKNQLRDFAGELQAAAHTRKHQLTFNTRLRMSVPTS